MTVQERNRRDSMKHRFPVAELARRSWFVLILSLAIAMPATAGERSREQGSSRPSAPSTRSGSSGSSHASPSSPSSSSSARTPVPRSGGSSSTGAPANGGRDRERAGRGHSGGHGGHSGGHYHGYYPRSYWGVYYGGYPYWWWAGPDYGYPYYYGYGSPGGYAGYGEDASGALDLDVAPDKTQVFLDGQYLGTVDDFDGWPQYLWLERGTYDLVLYLPGFKTVAKQISVYPGVVIDVGDRLEPGESIRPEDLPSKSHERRDARVEQDRRRAREVEEGRGRPGWRDRYRGDDRRQPEAGREEEMDDDDSSSDDGALDARDEPARLKISIEPSDASVYLDGQFVGTGNDLSRRASGLLVDPGEHKLSVVRPGRRSVERTFQAEAGEEVELDIVLSAE
jgi:PEGA domain